MMIGSADSATALRLVFRHVLAHSSASASSVVLPARSVCRAWRAAASCAIAETCARVEATMRGPAGGWTVGTALAVPALGAPSVPAPSWFVVRADADRLRDVAASHARRLPRCFVPRFELELQCTDACGKMMAQQLVSVGSPRRPREQQPQEMLLRCGLVALAGEQSACCCAAGPSSKCQPQTGIEGSWAAVRLPRGCYGVTWWIAVVFDNGSRSVTFYDSNFGANFVHSW